MYTQDFKVDYGVVNLTANIASNFLLKLGANVSPYETDGLLPGRSGRSNLPDQDNYAPLGQKGERETYSLIADWIAATASSSPAASASSTPTSRTPAFRRSTLIHNYSTGVGQRTSSRTHGPIMDPQWQQGPGFFSDNLQTGVNHARTSTSGPPTALDATWYFKGAGDHSLKFGYQNEKIFNDVASGYNADRILYYWGTLAHHLRG